MEQPRVAYTVQYSTRCSRLCGFIVHRACVYCVLFACITLHVPQTNTNARIKWCNGAFAVVIQLRRLCGGRCFADNDDDVSVVVVNLKRLERTRNYVHMYINVAQL